MPRSLVLFLATAAVLPTIRPDLVNTVIASGIMLDSVSRIWALPRQAPDPPK
jgi:hypothetical protein